MNFRNIFTCCAAACIGLIAGSYFIEFNMLINPCPLCILQRFVYYLLGIIFLIGALHNPKAIGRKIYCTINIIFATIGTFLAGWQIWFQNLPIDNANSCAADLQILLKIHPLLDVLKIILEDKASCSDPHLIIFGLSLAHWSLLCFLGFMLVCFAIISLRKKKGGTKRHLN